MTSEELWIEELIKRLACGLTEWITNQLAYFEVELCISYIDTYLYENRVEKTKKRKKEISEQIVKLIHRFGWFVCLFRESRKFENRKWKSPLQFRQLNRWITWGPPIRPFFMHQFKGRRFYYCFVVHLKLWVVAFATLMISFLSFHIKFYFVFFGDLFDSILTTAYNLGLIAL